MTCVIVLAATETACPISAVCRPRVLETPPTIAELEARMDHLARELRQRAGDKSAAETSGAPVPGHESLRDLADWLESLNGLLAAAPLKAPEKSAPADEPAAPITFRPELPRPEDELDQMRLQIANLSQQFALAERQINEVQGRRSRHRGRVGETRPLWKKVARRLGLRGSQYRRSSKS